MSGMKTLSRTEQDFVLRAIADVQHLLTVMSGMTAKEKGCEPFPIDHRADVALLELVQHLLGGGDQVPLPLAQQFGIKAAIEGDAKALELYEEWRRLATQRP